MNKKIALPKNFSAPKWIVTGLKQAVYNPVKGNFEAKFRPPTNPHSGGYKKELARLKNVLLKKISSLLKNAEVIFLGIEMKKKDKFVFSVSGELMQ